MSAPSLLPSRRAHADPRIASCYSRIHASRACSTSFAGTNLRPHALPGIGSAARPAPRSSLLHRAAGPKQMPELPELPELQPDAPGFGPRALIVGGFQREEEAKIKSWFQLMAPGVPILPARGTLLRRPLSEVLDAAASATPLPPIPFETEDEEETSFFADGRAAILSGMTGLETMAILEGWEEFSETPRPVCGSYLPGSEARTVRAALARLVQEEKIHTRGMEAEPQEVEDNPTLIVQSGRVMKKLASASGLRDSLRTRMEEKGLVQGQGQGAGPSSKAKGPSGAAAMQEVLRGMLPPGPGSKAANRQGRPRRQEGGGAKMPPPSSSKSSTKGFGKQGYES